MAKGSKQDAQGRTASGGVSNQLVKEVAARIKQYGQVLPTLAGTYNCPSLGVIKASSIKPRTLAAFSGSSIFTLATQVRVEPHRWPFLHACEG